MLIVKHCEVAAAEISFDQFVSWAKNPICTQNQIIHFQFQFSLLLGPKAPSHKMGFLFLYLFFPSFADFAL